MAKKKCPECEAGAPKWMVTYGDLMSLLLTFFVLLVSFSSMQESKFKAAMGSLQAALGVLESDPFIAVNLETMTVNIPTLGKDLGMNEIEGMMDELIEIVEQAKMMDQIKVTKERGRIKIEISSPILFQSGKAELKDDFKKILNQLGNLFKKTDSYIRVEGHTDNIPIKTQQFSSNWELSARRAVNVVRYFSDSLGIKPERLSAVGYGEFRPIADNDTAKGRQKNRRVELYVMPPQRFSEEDYSPEIFDMDR